MSDILVIGLTIVVVWALWLIFTYRIRVARFAIDERRQVRVDEWTERETGVIAQLKKQMEAAEKEVASMRTEQKTFLANARSR